MLTTTLISVSAFFVFLHVPYGLATLWFTFYPDKSVILMNNPTDFVRFHLYTFIGIIISEFQNWINFFIYILTGKTFRNSFVKIVFKFGEKLSTYSGTTNKKSRTKQNGIDITGV